MFETKSPWLSLRAVLCFAAVLASAVPVLATGPVPQTLRFHGGGYDRAGASTVDSAGNFYVTGSAETSSQVHALVVVKYNAQGAQLWRTTVNQGVVAKGQAIVVDATGNVYASGYGGGSLTFGGTYDYLTVKLNASGAVQWSRVYDGPARGTDQAREVAVDATGNVYVSGSSYGQGFDWATLKYSPTGTLLWERRLTGPGAFDDGVVDLERDSAGNLVITGTTQRTGDGQTNDITTVKYDPTGTELWQRHLTVTPLSHEIPSDLAVDSAGSVYVTGTTAEDSSPYVVPFPVTVKYDGVGAEQFVLRDQASGGGAIAVDGTGAFYVTGFFFGLEDFSHTAKYNSNGTLVWASPFAISPSSALVLPFIGTDSTGNVYVAATIADSFTFKADYFTVKYDPAGTELWQSRFNGAASGADTVAALAIGANDAVYVTGTSWGNYGSLRGTADDILTRKFPPGSNTPPSTSPAAPSQLSASAFSATRIDLRWTDNASTETGFAIERCRGANCTSFSEVARTGVNTTTFVDANVVRNTSYSYRVRALGTTGDSSPSNTASARTPRR